MGQRAKHAARRVDRARIVRLAAAGKENCQIATQLGLSKPTVGLWRKRFAQRQLAGIKKDAPRGGRRPTRMNRLARRILETTRRVQPQQGAQWSVRTLARATAASPSMVHRVWKAHRLQPHRTRTFKLSRNPLFNSLLVHGHYLGHRNTVVVRLARWCSVSMSGQDRARGGRCGVSFSVICERSRDSG